MTVFEETFQEIDSFGKTFDETANKIRVLTEYVVSDYNVDVASVKLEQKKDDTITDAQVSESLYEVTEKCNGKLKKTMGSINRNSQDYFSKMNASLQKITNDPSYQETIDKAGALCKEFPKLGKVEVTYNASEEEAKAIAKGMDQLQTVISKGKARKNFTDADSAKIDEIINATNKERQAAGKKDNWMKRLKGRKHMQGINKLIGRQLLPNASVIITESEAFAIQQDCGVDPHNPADATKMMDKYFMLAFGIYDTESKLLDIIYDGESQFSSYSIRELVAKNKKDTNLLTSSY